MTAPRAATSRASAEGQPGSRRTSPRWALVAWWFTLGVGVIILIASLPTYALYFQGITVLIPDAPSSPFAILSGLASLFTVLVCLTLAVVLYRLKRADPMALFVSFYLITYGIVMAGPVEFLDTVLPGASELAVRLIQPIFLGVPTIALLVLFPDGRPIPRWSRWLIPIAALSLIFLPWLGEQSGPYRLPSGVEAVTWILMMGTVAASVFGQVYRYRQVSTPAQRQQTRWVLVGFLAWFLLLMIQGIPYAYLGSLPSGTPVPAWASGSAALWFLSLSFVPVSLAIAILRYRLYEIDVIINRALVYGGLTAILAGVYTASIGLSQRVFIAVTGEQSDAAIVLTTLVVASAFTPVRSRLQSAVDRRFKDVHDPTRRLATLADEISEGIWVVHPEQACHRLLVEAVSALGAAGGVVSRQQGKAVTEIARVGSWTGKNGLLVPLVAENQVLGQVDLAGRLSGSPYTSEDRQALAQAAEALALALARSPISREERRPARPPRPRTAPVRRKSSRTPRTPVRRGPRS